MSDEPLYESDSTVQNLWQRYAIYEDRLDLHTHLGTMTVPFDRIERAEAAESDVAGLLRGELQLSNFRSALKLD